jgi:hypothetical protein
MNIEFRTPNIECRNKCQLLAALLTRAANARLFRNSIFIFLLPAHLLAQGPLDGFLKGRGVLDLAPTYSATSARTFLAAGGARYALPYRGSLLSIFAEYGLSRRLDLVATGAYVFTSVRSGLQDGGLYAKYRPYYGNLGAPGKLGVLVATGLAFPLSDYEPTAAGAIGQKAVVLPGRLIVQWETPPGLFLNLTGGYNWRLDRLAAVDVARIRSTRPDYAPAPPASFATFLVKLGYPMAHYYFDAWIEWQATRGGADFVPDVVDLPQAYGVSYTQVGGTVFYNDQARFGLVVSGGYIVRGRNTSKLGRISVGCVVKLGARP